MNEFKKKQVTDEDVTICKKTKKRKQFHANMIST